jgi:ParB/RepB/Spo0J family partition protein
MTAAIAIAPPLDANSASVNIPVNRILRSPFNRQPELNEDFVANIRQYGVLQPILVRQIKIGLSRLNELPLGVKVAIGDTVYEIVAGERRWLASKKTNKASIPAVIRDLTDLEVMEIQIVENDHREDYSVMDRAESYANLRAKHMEAHKGEKGWTEEKCMALIASRLNQEHIKGRTVQQIIALKKLSMECQMALRKGEIEASHGYELCRRTVEDQGKLLLWLRQQTHHSQGDIPSVRRLKREIVEMERVAEERRRQEKLFKDPQPGTATTPVPTVGEVAAAAPGFKLLKERDLLTELDDNRKRDTAAQTSAPTKPPTKAQLKAEEERRQKEAKAQRDGARNARINKKYQGLFFAAFARKASINSRFLTHAIPDLVHSSIDGNTYDEFEIDAVFGQRSLGWPAPAGGNAYSAEEVCYLTKKHTRGFTPGLLAAVIATIHMTPAASEKLIRYFGVDPKKLRKQAADAVKEEEEARLPKEPKTNKEKQLHAALHGYADSAKRWNALRSKGASNEELKKAIAANMSTGGKAGPGWGPVSCRSAVPAIWFNAVNSSGKPSLQGPSLLAAVRDLLKIPEKGDVDA